VKTGWPGSGTPLDLVPALAARLPWMSGEGSEFSETSLTHHASRGRGKQRPAPEGSFSRKRESPPFCWRRVVQKAKPMSNPWRSAEHPCNLRVVGFVSGFGIVIGQPLPE
jgi:hypothetical protein